MQEKFATELNYGSSTLLALVETLAKNMDTYISGLNRGGAVQMVTPQPAEPPVTWPEQYLSGDGYQPFEFGGNHVDLPQAGDVSFASRGRGQFSQPFRPRGGQFSSRGFNPRFQQPRPHPQFRPRGAFSSNSGGSFARQSGPVCEYCYLQVQTRKAPHLDYHHNISSCDQVNQMQSRSRVGYTEQADVTDDYEYGQFVEDFNQFGVGDSQQ